MHKKRPQKRNKKKERSLLIIFALFAAVALFVWFKLNVPMPATENTETALTAAATSEGTVVDFDRLYSAVRPDIKKIFGRPKDIITERRPFHEQRITWTYDGLTFKIFAFINPIGKDTEQVYEMEITGDKYVTKDGLKIGMSREKIIEVSGEPRYETEGSLTYISSPSGSPALKYYLGNGTVTKILFYDEQYFEQKDKDGIR